MYSDKFKLGLFIILFFAVVFALFIIFGVFDYGAVKVPVTTCFRESVQGLENGSLVKLRGVPIGNVKNITFNMQDRLILVEMEVDLHKFWIRSSADSKAQDRKDSGNILESISRMITDQKPSIRKEEFFDTLSAEIRAGLRAQLAMTGITGGKYVELDYVPEYDRGSLTTFAGLKVKNTFFIPSKPSMLMGLRTNAMEIIAKIASIDYKGLSDKLEKILVAVDKLVQDPGIGKTIQNLQAVSEKTGKVLQSAEMTLDNVNTAFDKKRLHSIAEETESLLKQLKNSTARLQEIAEKSKVDETSASVRNAAGTVADLRPELKRTLAALNATLAAMDELLKTVDEHPEIFLKGKKQ